MNRDYRLLTDKILEKRDNYIEKRKQTIKVATLLLVPICCFVLIFSFLPRKDVNVIKPERHYLSIQVHETTENGTNKIEVTNEEKIDCIIIFINEKLENNPTYNKDTITGSSAENFTESVDYFVEFIKKDGQKQVLIVTKEYILISPNKAFAITKTDFLVFKNILLG